MSKYLVFGFTSSKSHLLPSLFNALQLQQTLLINISKFLCLNPELIKKIMISEKINNTFDQKTFLCVWRRPI